MPPHIADICKYKKGQNLTFDFPNLCFANITKLNKDKQWEFKTKLPSILMEDRL